MDTSGQNRRHVRAACGVLVCAVWHVAVGPCPRLTLWAKLAQIKSFLQVHLPVEITAVNGLKDSWKATQMRKQSDAS